MIVMQVSNFQNQNLFRSELEINSHQPFFWTALISWRHSSAFCVDGLKPADKDETNKNCWPQPERILSVLSLRTVT